MIRQDIYINNFKYICDLFTANDSDYKIVKEKQFVIIRNLTMLNNVAYDTDIYFVERNIFEELFNDFSGLKNKITTKIVFPCYNSTSGTFSTSYNDYSTIINNFNLEENGGNICKIIDKEGNYKDIPCDKLRIYHPFNKVDLDYIIYLDNYINGIHFHYFCNRSDNFTQQSSEEIVVDNNIYSEYFELYIPNLNFLFTDENTFFNDVYNITKYCDSKDVTKYNEKYKENETLWITSESKTIDKLIPNISELSYVPFKLLLNPFYISDDNNKTEKIYYRISNLVYNNYNSFPINITLYPFIQQDDNNIYLLNPDYEQNTDTFVKEYKFLVTSKINFLEGRIACINKFEYPDSNKLTLQEAYAKYNGLTYDKTTGKCKEYEGWIDDTEENYEDIPIKCCGFELLIGTDYLFNNIIYKEYNELNFIDDFAFDLTGILNNWFNLPEMLIVRARFLDKYLGASITSTFNILTKEQIKYIINNSPTGLTRIYKDFTNKANEIKNIKTSNVMGWNSLDSGSVNFNFIDKINCAVIKNESNTNQVYNGNSNTRVIYKPIFYKTKDLSNITIKTGMKQNIGINLAGYMNKVELFKLIIDDLEYTETSRNDIYVIFQINAATFTNTEGEYNIVDNDDNYISSGSWQLN